MSRRAAQGYLLVAGSFVIMGLIGVLVEWATAPESALLVLRFVTAGLVLGLLFARSRPLAGIRDRSIWPRLLLMGFIDAATLLLFFIALRGTSVAIGMFLQFLAPVWVALLAPRVFRVPTERIVYPALGVALARPGRDPDAVAARGGRQGLDRRRRRRASPPASATPSSSSSSRT